MVQAALELEAGPARLPEPFVPGDPGVALIPHPRRCLPNGKSFWPGSASARAWAWEAVDTVLCYEPLCSRLRPRGHWPGAHFWPQEDPVFSSGRV